MTTVRFETGRRLDPGIYWIRVRQGRESTRVRAIVTSP